MEATKMSLWYVASFPLDQYQAWLNAAHFGQDMAWVDTSFAHLSRAFREPFARNRKKKWVDTISYLVFRGSSANLSPTCTFLERCLSRKHFKSMPVDLDYIKPFMGFCTTLIYYIHSDILRKSSIASLPSFFGTWRTCWPAWLVPFKICFAYKRLNKDEASLHHHGNPDPQEEKFRGCGQLHQEILGSSQGQTGSTANMRFENRWIGFWPNRTGEGAV